MPNKTLYVGADDSNHGNKAKPAEVIMAIFSFESADSFIRRRTVNKKRNHRESINWLEYPLRDYRFTILKDVKFASTCYNLPLVVPFLISDYLTTNPDIKNLEIQLDGALLPIYKEMMVKNLEGFENVSVSNFAKSGIRVGENRSRNLYKHQMRSPLIHHADILANAFFRGMNVPRNAENHVYIPLEQLLEKEKEYASPVQRV